MREQWARRLALFTGLWLLVIAAALAAWHNHSPREGGMSVSPASDQARPSVAAALSDRGSVLFREQGCFRCHSVAGVGNPRSPLDGVGSRRSAVQLRAWITADATLAGSLSTRTRAVKQGYAKLPADQLDALVAYVQSIPER